MSESGAPSVKRRRLSIGDDVAAAAAASAVPNAAVSTTNTITSASSSSSSVTVTPPRTDEGSNLIEDRLSTYNELSKDLSKLVRSSSYRRDDAQHNNEEEALGAVKNLLRWAERRLIDGVFLKNFLELGGVPKVRAYLEDNLPSTEFCFTVLPFIVVFIAKITYPGDKGEHFSICKEIFNALVKQDGLRLLLAAEEMLCNNWVPIDKETDEITLDWLDQMWATFSNGPRCYLDKGFDSDQLLPIIDAGANTIAKLSPVPYPLVSRILERIFEAMTKVLQLNEYISPSDFNRTKKKVLLPKFVGCFERERTWDGFDSCGFHQSGSLLKAVEFLATCFERKIFSTRFHYETVIPLFVQAIKQYPSEARRYGAFDFIVGATWVISNKRPLKKSGLAEVLSIVWAADDIDEETKTFAEELMQRLKFLFLC